MTEQHPFFDPEMTALCEDAERWLFIATMCATALGVSVTKGIEELKAQERIYTGYLPKAQRRNVTHRLLRDGLRGRRLPKDPSIAIKAKARALGFEVQP